MIRVLIVDDHPIVRDGVTGVLAREADIEVVGEADTLDEGLRLDARQQPDVILLDLKLPGADAARWSDQLRRTRPRHRGVHRARCGRRGVRRDSRRGARIPAEGIAGGGDRAGDPAGARRRVVPQPAHRGEAGEGRGPAARPHRRAERTRARCAPAGRRRPVEPPDRRNAVDHGADGEVPRHGDLQQARRREPRPSRGDRRRARAC